MMFWQNNNSSKGALCCKADRQLALLKIQTLQLLHGDIVYAAGIGFQSQGNIFTYQQVYITKMLL